MRKKGQKIVKRVADLPSVYVNEAGVAATPLPQWNPTYIVPPPPGWFLVYHKALTYSAMLDADVGEGEPKPKRKARKKKEVKNDEQNATKIIDSGLVIFPGANCL